MKIITYLKGLQLLSGVFLLSSLCYASSPTTIQNITAYTFTLTNVVLKSASCVPSCVANTLLIPGATQEYNIQGSSGSITFDYDVNSGSSYVGHITLLASPTGVQVTNGVGASVRSGTVASQVSYVPPMPTWQGKFSSLSAWTNNNWKVSSSLPQWGNQNIKVRPSTLADPTPYRDNYLRIKYPAGSANSAASPPLPLGGTQFYGAMIDSSGPITLSFYIRFPTTFPFTGSKRGATLGKLPGLYGGRGNTGTHVPNGYDGWSTRFMWCDYIHATKKKVSGGGELLQFTVGSNKGLTGTVNGIFLDCNAWSFKADGKWHNIQQTVYMNSPGASDGRVDVCYDGKLIFSQSGITYRKTAALQINGILFQSFFGGSGADYATPRSTYADFADFALYQHPQTPSGTCVTNVNKAP